MLRHRIVLHEPAAKKRPRMEPLVTAWRPKMPLSQMQQGCPSAGWQSDTLVETPRFDAGYTTIYALQQKCIDTTTYGVAASDLEATDE